MTEAEHNRPIPKLFDNQPSASATEHFGLLIGHWKFQKKYIFFLKNAFFLEKKHVQIFHTSLQFYLQAPSAMGIQHLEIYVGLLEIKVQFSHGLVKNWLNLLIEEDESINKIS